MSINTTFGSRQDYTKRIKDVVGRLKVSIHQNIYEADFEYGLQPMRWENYTNNGGTITHLPGVGGCAMYLPPSTTNPNAITIRQSRPYHRYQPGKAMFMATAVNFGAPATNQFQRVGFFDDSNGIFFQQGVTNSGNPAGMYCVLRSDTNYYPNGATSTQPTTDVVIDFANWSDPQGVKNQINWNTIQMLWIEYAWYGAGCLRWGVFLNGEQYILHEIGAGNNPTYLGGTTGTTTTSATLTATSPIISVASATNIANGMLVSGTGVPANTYVTLVNGTQITLSNAITISGTSVNVSFTGYGFAPWARTGNLPVRYEQRDSGQGAGSTTMYHYGVSVVVEGKKDEQRGFTYSYGMDRTIPRRYVPPNTLRYPVLSIQPRNMGTQEFSQVGGPGNTQSNIISSATNYISVGSTFILPKVQSAFLDSTNKLLTIVFQKEHKLIPNGSVTLTSWGGGIDGSNLFYAILSPSSIQITYASAVTLNKPYGNVTATTANGSWAINQWVGRSVTYLGTDGLYYTGKITGNNAGTITFQDVVLGPGYNPSQPGSINTTITPAIGVAPTGTITSGSNVITAVSSMTGVTAGLPISNPNIPIGTLVASTTTSPNTITLTTTATGSGTAQSLVIGQNFTIGQINRGQLLPFTLLVSSDSLCVVELIASAAGNPVALTNPAFTPLAALGSANSFATRDVSATAMTQGSGEVVYAFTTPAGSGLQSIDLTNFFPLYNTIVGNAPDILTIAVSTKAVNSPGIEISSAVASGTTGTIGFVQPHGLNVGDQVILSGFTPTGWNNTFTITAIPDAYKVSVTIASGTTSATNLGVSTFLNGANVGAHIICQEAMS